MNWITDTLPDVGRVVLMRLESPGGQIDRLTWSPIWPGFYDGEDWCFSDNDTCEWPVLGWMNFEDAAAVLDGQRKFPPRRRRRTIKTNSPGAGASEFRQKESAP